MLFFFDVLNCKFIDAEIEMTNTSERKLAFKLLENYECSKDIFLFDRGPSVELIRKMNEKGLKFVMRVQKIFIREVNKFISQSSMDKNIHIVYTTDRAKKRGAKNITEDYSFDLRCIKIALGGGKNEILITNLSREHFKRQDIGKLYKLRWGH